MVAFASNAAAELAGCCPVGSDGKVEITLKEAVDQAIDRLQPRIRRRSMKRRMRWSRRFRNSVYDDCAVCVYDDCDDCGLGFLQATFGHDEFTAETKFKLDMDQLERFFQILIEYLPKLLQIILPLFT